MDSTFHSSLLGYIACELTMPAKSRISYTAMVLDQSSINDNFLTAGADIAKETHDEGKKTRAQTRTNFLKSKPWLGASKSKIKLKKGEHMPTSSPELVGAVNKANILGIEKNVNQLNTIFEIGLSKAKPKKNRKDMQSSKLHSKHTNDAELESIQFLPDEEFDADNHIVIKEEEVQHDWNAFETAELTACSNEFQNYEEMINSDVFLLLNEEDFKATFRVSHSSFKILVLLLSNEEMEPIENIPLYKKLLIVLWLLGHSKSYNDAAQLFSVTEESVSSCFYDVCATLYDKCDNIINWPNSVQCSGSAERIEQELGFPGVVGVLGCQYFSMSIPKEPLSRREHFNGKLRTYCLALQIVCDDKFIIRDIFPGLPGGRAESQVFKESPLCELLKSKTLVEPNKHILARSYYPQLPSMLTPYTKDCDILTKDEIDFNDLHENVCQLVDQTFHMLTERFISLKRLDPETATMVLVTVCVIHNICMDNSDYI